MKKLICISALLTLIIACKDKKKDDVKPKTSLVTKITSANDSWNFEYDAELKMSSASYTYGTTVKNISFNYDPNGKVSSSVMTDKIWNEKYQKVFEYDSENRLTKVVTSKFYGTVESALDTTEIDYKENGYIWVHAPGSTATGGNFYSYQDGNMKNIICFDCLSSSFNHTYFTEQKNFLPVELRQFWNLMTTQPIKFLSYYSLGSENLLKKHFDLIGMLPAAVENNYEVDSESGKVLKVSTVIVKEPNFFVPTNYAVGDTLATYEFTYSDF